MVPGPTIKLDKVPTDVKLLETTVPLSVVPVNVLAAAVTVISALPLKETPFIFLDVAKLVAVPELPLMLPDIVLVTVKLPNVPTDVKLLVSIVLASVFPVRVLAAAVTVPLAPNAINTPFTVRLEFNNFVLVILPDNILFVIVPISVVYIPLVTVPAFPLTFPVTFPVNAPEKVVLVTLVSPAKVVALPPNDIAVVPTVKLLLTKLALVIVLLVIIVPVITPVEPVVITPVITPVEPFTLTTPLLDKLPFTSTLRPEPDGTITVPAVVVVAAAPSELK